MKKLHANFRLQTNWKLLGILCLSFLIPAVILIVAYYTLGFYPFGEKSVLVMDMSEQFAPALASLRQITSGESSILFSWSKSMGTNNIGFFAFYMSSPFSFITLLFPESQFLLSLWILTVLKISLSGLTMAIFLHRFLSDKPAALLLLSSCYALMSYNLVYSLSIMWLDVVIWLPIVILGVEWILEQRTPLLLIFSLAVMFLSNYYISYMAGVFTACYFLYRYFAKTAKYSISDIGKKFLTFFLSVIAAAGLSAWLTIPTLFDLMQGKMKGTRFPENFLNFEPLKLFTKFLPGQYDTIQYHGLPSVFCGTVVLVLVVIYFLLRNFSLKEKLLSAGFVVFMICSFIFTVPDTIWHIFQSPNWFPHRYAFVFSFLLIFLAAQTVSCLPAFGSLVSAFRKKSEKRILQISLVFLSVLIFASTFGELYYNAKTMINGLDDEFRYRTTAEYENFFSKLRPLVAKAKEDNSNWYRIEKDFEWSKNDALTLGYNGITHYSSVYNHQINQTLKKLGLAQDYFWNSYFGSTPVTDCIFGVRYIMSEKKLPNFYQSVMTNDGITLYENPYYLPVGFIGSVNPENVLSLDHYLYLENQNRLLSAICGKNTEVFHEIAFEKETVDDSKLIYRFNAVSDNPIYISLASNTHANAKIYVNGQEIASYFGSATKHSLYLGSFEPGQELEVVCQFYSGWIDPLAEEICELDTETFSSLMVGLQENGMKTKSYQNGNISGSVSMPNDGYLYTSIPFDKGFTLSVDGKKADYKAFQDTFIMVSLSKGIHEIKFTFYPTGFRFGVGITVVTVLVLSLFLLCRYRTSRKRDM